MKSGERGGKKEKRGEIDGHLRGGEGKRGGEGPANFIYAPLTFSAFDRKKEKDEGGIFSRKRGKEGCQDFPTHHLFLIRRLVEEKKKKEGGRRLSFLALCRPGRRKGGGKSKGRSQWEGKGRKKRKKEGEGEKSDKRLFIPSGRNGRKEKGRTKKRHAPESRRGEGEEERKVRRGGST